MLLSCPYTQCYPLTKSTVAKIHFVFKISTIFRTFPVVSRMLLLIPGL